MAKFSFRAFKGEAKKLAVAGGAGTVAAIVWDAGVQRVADKFLPDAATSKSWFAPALKLAGGLLLGPALATKWERVGLGTGIALVSAGGRDLLEALTMGMGSAPSNISPIFGQVVISPLGAPPMQVPYSPSPMQIPAGQGDQRSVLLGDASSSSGDMGEATSTTITQIGGFADASPVLLERVMAAIS